MEIICIRIPRIIFVNFMSRSGLDRMAADRGIVTTDPMLIQDECISVLAKVSMI
jgi:hypothetical protein